MNVGHPLVLEPDCCSTPDQTTVKEWISFEHSYNCRLEPSLPAKGKVSPRHVIICKKMVENCGWFSIRPHTYNMAFSTNSAFRCIVYRKYNNEQTN